MALFKPDLADRVSCTVCMEQYDNRTHVPKILPCQHTFCSHCLSSITLGINSIECPVCRCRQQIPSSGFTTNRALLDIIDEIQKDTSPVTRVLKCEEHPAMVCVLVCVDCVCGLCIKCIKQSSHQEHQLEEIDDAKDLLMPTFMKRLKRKKSKLERKLKTIRESPDCVTEIVKAESDVGILCDNIERVIFEWKNNQLSVIQNFKEMSIARENEIQMKMGFVQSLVGKQDIDTETMLEKIKGNDVKQEQVTLLHLLALPNDYNYGERCHLFLEDLRSILNNDELVTSTLLTQNPHDEKPETDTKEQDSTAVLVGDRKGTTSQEPAKTPATSTPAVTNLATESEAKSAGPQQCPKSNGSTAHAPDPKTHIVIKRVVHELEGLLVHINNDIIFYHFNTSSCDMYPIDSQRGRDVMHRLDNWYSIDVKQFPPYQKYIEKIREFYRAK